MAFPLQKFMWDHPRVSGEHQKNLPFPFSGPGSSPRERGARRKVPRCVQHLGIIPA